MSIRPDEPVTDDAMEALLDAASQTGPLADAVEAHLDHNPIPVDDDAIEAAAARLEERIRRSRVSQSPASDTRWGWALLAAAIAALTLTVAGLNTADLEQSPDAESASGLHPATSAPKRSVQPGVVLPATPQLHFERAQRSVAVAPQIDVVSSESDQAAVLLVREGEAWTPDRRIPEGHWALLRRLEDGSAADVVFEDGTAPPPLPEDVWGGTDVQQQLKSLRWNVLPDTTTDTLDRLLEDR